MTKSVRIALAVACSFALAGSVSACGDNGSEKSKVSTVTESVKTVIEQQQNQNNNQNNGNESLSKQKAECLAHNKGYPENCSDIP